jgi:NADH-quinone oxidoreductase subunit G
MMLKITINGKQIEVPSQCSVLQACEIAGIEIPRFCYHKRLKVAGNCRMCLVEIEKAPKLVASCSMPISQGMSIHTNTMQVQKAREGVMEFLLINHPLDCPICDQGGECDLQDQAFKYGKNFSRFAEDKRSIKDKNMGPLVRTHMTRCIHCTRCIRFASDIAGVEEIGTIGRGEHMEVSTYLEKAITSELSGNLIDICPVGALTAKPYEFTYRSWELTHTKSIDVHDALGSNIRIDSKGNTVVRILPEENNDINQEWLSDKARFSYDGLKYQRLQDPYIKIDGKFCKLSWPEALDIACLHIKSLAPHEIAAVCGNMIDAESIFLFKMIMDRLGCKNIDGEQLNARYDTSARGNYLFNTTIAGIDQADFCLLVGANPRQNAPVLNARIGINQRERGLYVARIGATTEQNYKIHDLGTSVAILQQILLGEHEICSKISSAERAMIIIGDEVLLRQDAIYLQSLAHAICTKYSFIKEEWNGFNILHTNASSVAMLDIGFKPSKEGRGYREILQAAKDGQIKLLYLLSTDELDEESLGKAFVIYQGHHGDKGANYANLILPAAAYSEKDGIYINLEGRAQYARKAIAPPGQARSDSSILMSLVNKLGMNFCFDNLSECREEMARQFPAIKHMEKIVPNDFKLLPLNNQVLSSISALDLQEIKKNYYMSNIISRFSPTMLSCTKFILQQS